MKKSILKITLIFFLLSSCMEGQNYQNEQLEVINAKPISVNTPNIHKAYFASGCFWCVEAIYENIIGVDNVISGYSGGFTKNPTYNIVNTETTGHSETIEVIYNPKIISFTQLVEVYFGTQNIEQVNGQGPDKGSQYRSIIFFQNSEEKSIILDKIRDIENKNKTKVAAEVYPFRKFWKAEQYHQDFKQNNKFNSYILNVSNPRYNQFKIRFSEIINENK